MSTGRKWPKARTLCNSFVVSANFWDDEIKAVKRARRVAWTGEPRNEYKVLVGKLERKLAIWNA